MSLEDPEVAILRLGFVEKVQVLMSMKVKIIQDYVFNHLDISHLGVRLADNSGWVAIGETLANEGQSQRSQVKQ